MEHENLELQKACKAKDMQLATASAEASDLLTLKNKYSDDLAEAQACLDLAKSCASKIEKKHNKSEEP